MAALTSALLLLPPYAAHAQAPGGSYSIQSDPKTGKVNGYIGGNFVPTDKGVQGTSSNYVYDPGANGNPASYGGVSGASGAPGDAVSVTGSGAVGATFTWGPTGTPTPPAVIVHQHCSVGGSGSGSVTGVTVTANASGAAGSTASVADKYTVGNAPGATFSIPSADCFSPTVTVSGTIGAGGGVAEGVVNYSADLSPVTINLTGQDPTTNQALTGQQITATLSGIPPTWVKSYKWSFTGGTNPNPIKNYDTTAPNATNLTQIVPFTATDLGQIDKTGNGIAVVPISFYDQAKDAITVQCIVSLKFPDGTTGSVTPKSVQVKFLKPTVTAWEINTGSGPQQGLPFGVRASIIGTSTYTMSADEVWGPITISEPKPGTTAVGGQGCIAQVGTKSGDSATRTTVSPYPTIYQDVVKNASGKYVLPPAPALDGGLPFPYGYKLDAQGIMDLSANTGSSTWNVSQSGYSADEPYTPIFPAALDTGGNRWTTDVFSSSFDTYVMYQPPGGIWVPLQKLSWTYSLTAGPSAAGNIPDPYDHTLWGTSNSSFSGGTAANTDTPPSWVSVETPPLFFGPLSQ